MSKTERLFHPRTLVIHPDFKNLEEFIVSIPERFQRNEGTVIHQGRNELRKMEYNGKEYVIKSFHSPHLINRFVYGIFRPSKAKRSYDHAEMLLKIGVGTPQPVGYMNIRSGLLFDKSYYISLLSTCPYIYDNLFTQQFDYAEEVFRAIGKVTARLHEHGYAHKDYGRANILFQKTPNGITIEKYFISQKIERVKELLVYDELSLNEIAFLLNYSSTAHLSRQFKEVTGTTPSEFKKQKIQLRKGLDEIV